MYFLSRVVDFHINEDFNEYDRFPDHYLFNIVGPKEAGVGPTPEIHKKYR